MQRRPGKPSIEDDKVRITYENGKSSVLFEDISSISYESFDFNSPNWFMVILGVVGFVAGIASKSVPVAAGCLIVIAYGYYKYDQFDNVIIETRGGKQIVFSLDKNYGEKIVNQIEKRKRENRS